MTAILIGTAASAGVRSGVARIVRSAAELRSVHADEIAIVADIGAWRLTPDQAAGYVCELGGPLSSVATAARESGTPMAVGVQRATSIIVDGEVITLDGASGVVLLHRRPVASESASQAVLA